MWYYDSSIWWRRLQYNDVPTFKKCDEVIKREKATTDKEEWDEKELKAVNHIYSTISNKQLDFEGEEETAYKIMKKLDSMYLKESTALQIVCRID